MKQTRSGRLRSASLAALLVLLPVNGYAWSLPLSNEMLTLAGIVLVLGLGALFMMIYSFGLADREMTNLADELNKKSSEVVALVEAEREDDRIIEGLTDRLNQLKASLIHEGMRHVDGSPEIVFPKASASMSSGASGAPSIIVHPRIYSLQDFQTLAGQIARVAIRYERQFTVIRIRMNVAEREAAVGPQKANEEHRVALQVIANTLRTSDFATIEEAGSVIIAYPETSVTHVDAIMTRLRAALKDSAASELAIELDRDVQDAKSIKT